MFVIRRNQIDVFESARVPNFKVRMCQHVQDSFSRHAEILGNAGIENVVSYGIERAENYGFTQQPGVTLFIDLTLLLGRHFDTDLQLPWAAQILSNDAEKDQLKKAQRLHAEAMGFLSRVSGPDNEYIDEAQRKLLIESINIESEGAIFEEAVKLKLKRIWLEKYEYLQEVGLESLIRQGIEFAHGYRLDTSSGVLVCIGLMYMLGSGFDRDPLFAWSRPILNATEESDALSRTKQLHEAALSYLEKWCV